jgi:hypothetical protein
MGVEVFPMDPDKVSETGEYLAVSTCHDPSDDTVTLATIRRVVERTVVRHPTQSQWHIKTLVNGQPMTLDAALGFATRYAEFKNIPVIYTDEE